jgi:hypothetical protein
MMNLRGFWPGCFLAFFVGGILLICIVVGSGVLNPPPATGPLRVHQSDVLEYDPAVPKVVLRCRTCAGRGWSLHNAAGKPEICPVCTGTGRETVFPEHGLEIVPEGQRL